MLNAPVTPNALKGLLFALEMCLVVSLLMAGGWSMYQYVKPQLNKVQLTEKQRQLLGVQKEGQLTAM